MAGNGSASGEFTSIRKVSKNLSAKTRKVIPIVLRQYSIAWSDSKNRTNPENISVREKDGSGMTARQMLVGIGFNTYALSLTSSTPSGRGADRFYDAASGRHQERQERQDGISQRQVTSGQLRPSSAGGCSAFAGAVAR